MEDYLSFDIFAIVSTLRHYIFFIKIFRIITEIQNHRFESQIMLFSEMEKFQICSNLCPLCGGQEVIVLHWDNLSDCYRRPRDRGMFDANGLFVFQRFSPADRAGLEKMDYVWTVNNNEVITGKYL